MPRPAGRAGWVYTAATWWPTRTRASSVGTAKCGVPMKTTRSGIGSRLGGSDAMLALALLLARRFGEFPHYQVAFQLREVIDEQNPVQVVDLVLDADGQKAIGFLFLRLAVVIDIAEPHARRPLHLRIIIGDRQTTLFVDGALVVRAPDDLRIDQEQRAFWLLLARNVDGHNAARLAHLDRRQP